MSHAPRTREREGRRVAVHARSDQLAASDGGPPGRPVMDRAERRDAYGWHSGSSRSAWRAERRRYRRRRAMSLVYTCHRGPTTRHPVRGFTPAPALMVATTCLAAMHQEDEDMEGEHESIATPATELAVAAPSGPTPTTDTT
mmetsp:Transcript_11024/g.29524  ORF Transcript_11024/g.29524 Transcript_11024/m.29524 type:complete len:142 (-) Transcript_11024:89-514(-)